MLIPILYAIQLRDFVIYEISQTSGYGVRSAFVSGDEAFLLLSRVWHLICCLNSTPKPMTAVNTA